MRDCLSECPRCGKHFIGPPGKHNCHIVIKKRGKMVVWAMREGWMPKMENHRTY